MFILGINASYHESSACLIDDGVIVAAVEEERFNRIKHGKIARVETASELPWQSIEFCLNSAGVSLSQVDHIGYSFDPVVRLTKTLSYDHGYSLVPADYGTPEGEGELFAGLMRSRRELGKRGFTGIFHNLRHHDCHAASAFLVSPFESAGVLVVDGIAEFETTTLYAGRGNRLQRLRSIDYPNSLGLLWEKLCRFLGFDEHDACKVMGLAAYGDPHRYEKQLTTILGNGAEPRLADAIVRLRSDDFSGLEKLFGLPRRTEAISSIESLTHGASRYVDIAAALQMATERILLMLTEELAGHGFRYLCMAGGVALNCAANGKLFESGLFEDVFIQPAAHDGGTAVGAAYLVWSDYLGRPRNYVFDSAYLGPAYSAKDIESALRARGLQYYRPDDLPARTAEFLAQGKIVGWFDGRMELGPRALGNRSLLGDPRRIEIREELNVKVKHRELFRPFCPSVLEEKATGWFDFGGRLWNATRYMLAAVKVLPHQKHHIPAVVHVDDTCRVQVVDGRTAPKYHRLIQEFEHLTDVPIVLNTSFNDSEPIVCTPENAIDTFLKTRIDYMALGDFMVSRPLASPRTQKGTSEP